MFTRLLLLCILLGALLYGSIAQAHEFAAGVSGDQRDRPGAL